MTAIAKLLIEAARRIGRWILARVIAKGAHLIGEYMLERAESVFNRRLARAVKAGNKRRAAWLRGRISRWLQWGAWLVAWADKVGTCVADELDTIIAKAKGLPVVAKCEKFRRAA